jgi:PRTRC genetic system protein E
MVSKAFLFAKERDMTMFEELHALAASATLTMVISADGKNGRMTINVIPKPKKDVDEPALTKALSLTATPAEFDAEFVGVLKGYREVRQSLAVQAEATQEVLQAAKAASAQKAGEAMTKAVKVKPAPASTATVKVAATPKTNAFDESASGIGEVSPADNAAMESGNAYDLFG